MRKIMTVVILIFGLLSLTSCDLFSGRTISNDDHETCDRLMETLTTYVLDGDVEKTKSLFASRLYELETFNKDLDDLIDYIDGDFGKLGGRVTTGEYSNWDYEEKHFSLEYSVITSSDTFRFMIHYVLKDSRSVNNVGITSLYVLKISEDEFPNERYCGNINGSYDGIYVAFPHMLSEE